MLLWPLIKNKTLKMIPAALLVLVFAIPAELYMDFANTEPSYALLEVGSLIDNLNINASFDGISQTGTFYKVCCHVCTGGNFRILTHCKSGRYAGPL